MKLLIENLTKIRSSKGVIDNIHDTLVIAGYNNPIIHSDHGTEYSSYLMKDLHNKFTFSQSMSRIGNSLDNRPAEYFFSILKQEYLKGIGILDFSSMNKLIDISIFDYNHNRFQGNLQNMTPFEFKNKKKNNTIIPLKIHI